MQGTFRSGWQTPDSPDLKAMVMNPGVNERGQ